MRDVVLTVRTQELRCDVDRTYVLMNFFGYHIRKTRLHNAWNEILRLNDESVRQWGEVVRACNTLNARVLCLDEESEHTTYTPDNDGGPLPDVYLGMQRCAWCGALSATLKKCAGCSETR